MLSLYLLLWGQACKEGRVALVRSFLLAHPKHLDLLTAHAPRMELGGRTLLHQACWYGHTELVEFLVRAAGGVLMCSSLLLKLLGLGHCCSD